MLTALESTDGSAYQYVQTTVQLLDLALTADVPLCSLADVR
jgi:hypothetical protein